MFLVLRSSQNCRILILPPQMPCDLELTKTKIYLPNVHSMLNFRSICPLEAVLQPPLYKEPDFAVPHCRMRSRMQKSILCVFRNQLPQPVADLVVMLVVVSIMMMMIVARMEVATRITTAWTKQANEATTTTLNYLYNHRLGLVFVKKFRSHSYNASVKEGAEK